MKNLITLVLALLFGIFVLGCGKGEDTAQKSEKSTAKLAEVSESAEYLAMDVTNGGSIKGTVTFTGTIPARQKLEVTKDVIVCGKQPHYKEDVVVSSNKGLVNVVVSIANIRKGKALSTLGGTYGVDQRGCSFIPHVNIVPARAEFEILNNDGILHNIHTFSEINVPINLAQPAFKKKMIHTFDEPEIIRLACDVHTWMGAYIIVVDHPYYAITDARGNFEIKDIPAGNYTVEFWQETLGKQAAEVTVTAGATADANMEYTVGSVSVELFNQLASLD